MVDLGKEAANLSVEGSLGCRNDDQGVPLLSPFSLNLEGIGAQTCSLSVSLPLPLHRHGGMDAEVLVEVGRWDGGVAVWWY